VSPAKDVSLVHVLSVADYFNGGLFVAPRNSSLSTFLGPNMSSLPSALCPGPTAGLGRLPTVDAVNLQRRLKYNADLDVALGAIDFSFNEDHQQKYQPFWSPHFYLITSTKEKAILKKNLCKLFSKTEEIPRPVKISSFRNKARRRSYALKMIFRRRIGYNDIKKENGKTRKYRNTSYDKLRAAERLELFMYLDKIGLADRVFFLSAKPVVKGQSVKIDRC
jgi:hypothetical protein